MAKWIGRLAVEVTFEAKDANEAMEVANTLGAAKFFLGYPISCASNVFVAEIKEPDASPPRDSGLPKDSGKKRGRWWR